MDRGDGPNEMGSNLPAVDLGSGRTALAVSAGDEHTCAVLDDGSVKCGGWNGEGNLGIGSRTVKGDGPNEMGNNLPVVDLGRTRAHGDGGGGELSAHVCAAERRIGQVLGW